MPTIRHARGTRAALNVLASNSQLVPWQLYVLSDESRVAVATSTSTYQTFAKEGEGGGGATFSADLVFNSAVFCEASSTITNGAATESNKVLCWLVPNSDWDSDDLLDLCVQGVAANGTVTFSVYRNGPIVGTLGVAYLLE